MLATLKLGVHMMRQGEYISDHDVKVANWVAYVLCGGKITPGTLVSEQYLLDLEREAFLSLCGEKKTQERIALHVENRQAAEELEGRRVMRDAVIVSAVRTRSGRRPRERCARRGRTTWARPPSGRARSAYPDSDSRKWKT